MLLLMPLRARSSMLNETVEAKPAGLGARLEKARDRLGWTQMQAAEKLHLEPRAIAALEREDFAQLGGAVYARGHLRRYAELLGESPAEMESLFAQRPQSTAPPDLARIPRPIISSRRARRPTLGLWPVAVLAGVLLVGGLVWWALRSMPKHPAAGLETVTESIKIDNLAGAAPAPAGAPAAASATPTAAPATASAAPQLLAPATKAAAPAGPDPLRLLLHFRQDTWAEIYDAGGTRLWYDVGGAGSEQKLSGHAPLHLVLGNAAAVAITVNGKSVPLSATIRGTPNVRFSIGEDGQVSEAP
jgi:cytoskeleton protein RodZ